MVIFDVDLQGVCLCGVLLVDGICLQLVLDILQLCVCWCWVKGGWWVDVLWLWIGMEGWIQQLDGLLIVGGQQFVLFGDNFDVIVLLCGLVLSDCIDLGLCGWLYVVVLQVWMSCVWVVGEQGGWLLIEGELDEICFVLVGYFLGLSGVGGYVIGDVDGFVLDLVLLWVMYFDWLIGFGQCYDVCLVGCMVVWCDEVGGWWIGILVLCVQGIDYVVDVCGGVWFQGDGMCLWLQLVVKIDDVLMIIVKCFWIYFRMSKGVIDWFDVVLVFGQVCGGVGLVIGDLEDWLFDYNNGWFEVIGYIDNGSICFQYDWLMMDRVNVGIVFIGFGFELYGSGDLVGVVVNYFDVGIVDFGQIGLYVKVIICSDVGVLLVMLCCSLLQVIYGDILDNFIVKGLVVVIFDLLQLLYYGDFGGYLQGIVELDGVSLLDKCFELVFDVMCGQVCYGCGGFDVNLLLVCYFGQDGVFSLCVGDYVQDFQKVFEFELIVLFDVGGLFDCVLELNWFKFYIYGMLCWIIGVILFKVVVGSRMLVLIEFCLYLDLVGMCLELLVLLDKLADVLLVILVVVQLLMGSGWVDVVFGQCLVLVVCMYNNQIGVQVIFGSGQVDCELLVSGLVVNGCSGLLDVLEWIGLVCLLGGDDGKDLMLLWYVDVQVGQLLLVGGVFQQICLQLCFIGNSVDVCLDGFLLVGCLDVFNVDGGIIFGMFSCVYWQLLLMLVKVLGDGVLIVLFSDVLLVVWVQVSVNDIDLVRILLLLLDIDDLQFGKVMLGKVVLWI